MLNFENIDNTLSPVLIQQKYINTGLYLFLILYAGLAAPKLPSFVIKLFANPIFRLTILFLIAYLSVKDVQAAILVSIGLVITMMTLNNDQVNKTITNLLHLKKEGYQTEYMDNIFPTSYIPELEQPKEQYANEQEYVETFEEAFDGAEYANFD